ncbi:glycosyltransferase [Haloarchaeobius sp. HRN-SO-5]|uniref:glycosyltransferase n=1 Tax=Haloarchaeobius sp. HRN-SO-5 TaxID=3446118 RepID=UPI003EBEE70A
MDDDESGLLSRSSLALGVLGASWLAFGVLLWMILVVEPVPVPLWLFLVGLALSVLFGAGLLASRRWHTVWRYTFVPAVRVPVWVLLGGLSATVGVVVVSLLRPVSPESVGWLFVLCTGASYAVVTVTRWDEFFEDVSWPSWVLTAIAAVLVTMVVLSLVIGTRTFLAAVFLFSLLLFTFHVTFILPLALYQYVRGERAQELSTYPEVSVLIPAYDEVEVIGDCIESVLTSTYPSEKLEVVVVDDGSTDGTYEAAAAYRDQGVKVFHRDNGGKHAALNFGLQCSSSPVVATIDADSRPDPTALTKMVEQLWADPTIGALSPVVLASNDDSFLTALQRIEYGISNTNRRAYSLFEAVPVVPGCLGVYRREALEDIWGYDPDTVTEDFDLTVKLLKNGWSVRHGRGVVRTIVPDGWRPLWRQRLRWYCGGLETFRKHRDVLLSPQYRYLHALSLPAYLVSHLFGPVGSFVILGAVVWGLLFNPTTYLLALVLLFAVMTGLVTLFSIALEDEPLRMLAYAPLFFVGYKHFIDYTVCAGTYRAFFREKQW